MTKALDLGNWWLLTPPLPMLCSTILSGSHFQKHTQESNVSWRPSGVHMGPNLGKASVETFKSQACRDGGPLTLWLPKTNLMCKCPCLRSLPRTNLKCSASFFSLSLPPTYVGQFGCHPGSSGTEVLNPHGVPCFLAVCEWAHVSHLSLLSQHISFRPALCEVLCSSWT